MSRVLPHKFGLRVTNLYLLGVIEDEDLFGNLGDDDAVRVCLVLALEIIFMGRLLVDEIHDKLMRLVEKLEVWNDFRWGEYIWRRLYDQILNVVYKNKYEHLQGLSKSWNYVPTHTLSGFIWSFKDSKVNLDLTSTIAEHQSVWCDTISVEEIWLKDRVIIDLNSWVFKLEAIIKDKLDFDSEDDVVQDYLIQEDEEMCWLEEHKMMEALFLNRLTEEDLPRYNGATDRVHLSDAFDFFWSPRAASFSSFNTPSHCGMLMAPGTKLPGSMLTSSSFNTPSHCGMLMAPGTKLPGSMLT
nr:phospholipase-like protein [Tanacetum cinerariifolium]